MSKDSTQISGPLVNDSPLLLLKAVLDDLPQNSVALLRPVPLTFCQDRDDIDLLMTPQTRESLLTAAFHRAVDGQLHFRVEQRRDEKIRLTIWNRSAAQQVAVDLWSGIIQLGGSGRRVVVSADDILHHTADVPPDHCRAIAGEVLEHWPAVCRLEPRLELCLYILHLASKHRRLDAPQVTDRLQQMQQRIAGSRGGVPNWARSLFDSTPRQGRLHRAEWLPALGWLSQRDVAHRPLEFAARPRQRRRRLAAGLGKWFAGTAPWIAFCGCDGVGKTTLLRSLTAAAIPCDSAVAKKFYRRSLTYQLLGGLLRRTRGWSRCELDESVPVLLTIRAAAAAALRGGLRRLSPKQHRAVLLDRSLADSMIRHRRTDHPEPVARDAGLTRMLASAPTVLLVADHASLSRRKQEMTAAGSQRYQELLFRRGLDALACDLVCFANSLPLEHAAPALRRCLDAAWLNTAALPDSRLPAPSSLGPAERRAA